VLQSSIAAQLLRDKKSPYIFTSNIKICFSLSVRIIIAQIYGRYAIIKSFKRGEQMRYMVGEVVEGVITGIQPYGAFVYLDSKHNGLIHISEISERFVRDVHTYVKINERVKVKILDIDEDGIHFKLSLKAVEANKARSLRKRKMIQELPEMKKGFSSLAAKLDTWIKEAIE
jgi:hypothetical protein